jgi:hypothetical protein
LNEWCSAFVVKPGRRTKFRAALDATKEQPQTVCDGLVQWQILSYVYQLCDGWTFMFRLPIQRLIRIIDDENKN